MLNSSRKFDFQKRPHFHLFLISFVIIFFELACIRWLGATVVFLTFFTNLVLMACFLGMSAGCMAAPRRENYIASVIPLTLISIMLSVVFLVAYWHLNHMVIDVGNLSSAQLVYFGTEYRFFDPVKFAIPLWAVSGVFFLLIALTFAGLGQLMGRAFDIMPNRLAAYSINILGSLAGIVMFFIVSLLKLHPVVWFVICIIIFLNYVRRRTVFQITCAMFIIFFVSYGPNFLEHMFNSPSKLNFVYSKRSEIWSPYYKISYYSAENFISANEMGHQTLVSRDYGPVYSLPYLLMRDAAGKPFKDILIIGSGSGNDAAAAIPFVSSQAQIDAVEIDPVILSLGMRFHPNKPYSDKRVHCYLDDGRSFLRKNRNRKYDLIVYALTDSLVLHSGYSSLRLESFLFTKEAFEDIRNRLKPAGLFVMYNAYRQGWIIGRIVKMAQDVFCSQPLVFTMPYQDTINVFQPASFFTVIMAGNNLDSVRIQAIRNKFQEKKFFWLNEHPVYNYEINAYSDTAEKFSADNASQWLPIGPSKIDLASINITPTDAWPFLYLREKKIPFRPIGQGIIMVVFLSLCIMFVFSPVRFSQPNWQMFFLGAGFMLLETKGVVHMALLFGSTWVVNSIVFAAIFVMILLANLFVHLIKPRNLLPYYSLLVLALLINTLVPMNYFLSIPQPMRSLVSCVVFFIPIFFAGIIFAALFRDTRQPDVDLGSNIAGVVLGGISENLSLMVGYSQLSLIAVVFYILSLLFRNK
jgi:spermidine synthase